ncbi:MAG: 3-dehydroquinate synthase [Clostridia bacterium]|nr:3-dehydroquinate synthase [Clostridia bacterium]
MKIEMNLGKESYPIYLERGSLSKAGALFALDRKVLIVSDSGVPSQYAKTVASCAKEPYIEIFPQGEQNKNTETYQAILRRMVEEGFTRTDCVVAVGGGVCGDMAGFAAASYMRGVDFYNIPTTLLSQVDSSIGGKVAIDFMGYKNIVGAFYQPKGVLIDPDVLATLPPRQIANGLAESIKMAATFDEALFALLEQQDQPLDHLEKIIELSLRIKKDVVEKDPKEQGLRKVLNFGHTIGHAIESVCNLSELYHGECVGLGMLAMAEKEPRERIRSVLQKVGLPTQVQLNKEQVIAAMAMDKKMAGSMITVVKVEKIGSFKMEKISYSELTARMEAEL